MNLLKLDAGEYVTKIVRKRILIPGRVTELTLDAPGHCGEAKPGNFVILRVCDDGERFPLTIADADVEAGTITIVYLVLGKKYGHAGLSGRRPENPRPVRAFGSGHGYPSRGHGGLRGRWDWNCRHASYRQGARAGRKSSDAHYRRAFSGLVAFEDELKKFSHEVLVATDDGL